MPVTRTAPSPDNDFEESEDDLGAINRAALAASVVFSTDWTVETVVNQIRKGTILLDPIFQRRDAWSRTNKSRFIESLFLGVPIPQLVLAESPTSKGTFIVIDGKQRLLTLLSFMVGNSDGVVLRLKGLQVLSDLNGMTYEDIVASRTNSPLLDQFENQAIRTVVVRNWQDESVLYLIFHRLNTGSVRLSPQELRQALHPGPFLTFCFRYSEKSVGLRRMLRLYKPDFRMRDVELLLRFYAFRYFLAKYDGSLKDLLDRTTVSLNKRWATEEFELERDTNTFEDSVETTYEIFEQNAFRKWNGVNYERSFNRAVFDIMSLAFSDPVVRHKAFVRRTEVEGLFCELCSNNSVFRRSLETTTKSRQATADRIGIWFAALNNLLNTDLDPPLKADI